MIDLSTMTIPPADVVPEPTAEAWKRFALVCQFASEGKLKDATAPTMVMLSLARRCRELEAEVARLRKNPTFVNPSVFDDEDYMGGINTKNRKGL